MAETIVEVQKDEYGRIKRDEKNNLMIKVIISPERAKEINATSIDSKLEARLKGSIEEDVEFQVGELITDDIMALDKVGSGAKGHVYRVLWSLFPGEKAKDLSSIVKPCLPYVTRQHFAELLLRKDEEKSKDPNRFGKVLDDIAIDTAVVKGELRWTNPIHNQTELRQLIGSPDYKLLILKFITRRMMKDEPGSVKDFLKEASMLMKVGDPTGNPGIPRFVKFIETPKGMGYLAGYADGPTWSSMLGTDENWWRETPNGYKAHLDPKVALVKAINLHNTLAHIQQRGVYYGDVKDDNLIAGFDGGDYLLDFGFTEEVTPGKKILEEVGGNELLYSPEIIQALFEERNERGQISGFSAKEGKPIPYHPRSTVWAAGVLGWWLAGGDTKEYPFQPERTFEKLKHSIMYKPHTDPRFIHTKNIKESPFTDDEIDWMANFALRKDPDKRYSHARHARELEKLLDIRLRNEKLEDLTMEDINRNFTRPLEEIRTRSYTNPNAVMPSRPKSTVKKMPSMYARSRPASLN